MSKRSVSAPSPSIRTSVARKDKVIRNGQTRAAVPAHQNHLKPGMVRKLAAEIKVSVIFNLVQIAVIVGVEVGPDHPALRIARIVLSPVGCTVIVIIELGGRPPTVRIAVDLSLVDIAVRVIVEPGPNQLAFQIIGVALGPVDGAVIIVIERDPAQPEPAARKIVVVRTPVDIAIIVRIPNHPLPATLRIQMHDLLDIAVTIGVDLEPVGDAVLVSVDRGPGYRFLFLLL